MAEDKLVEAIRQLQELDGVDPDAEDCAHKVAAVLKFARWCIRNMWAPLPLEFFSACLFILDKRLFFSNASIAADFLRQKHRSASALIFAKQRVHFLDVAGFMYLSTILATPLISRALFFCTCCVKSPVRCGWLPKPGREMFLQPTTGG